MFRILGAAFVGLGLIGVVVPLLPTTIFFILAASCFARSSPKLEKWILDHPRFGPTVQAWRESGVISLSAKLLALAGMLLGFTIFTATAHPSPGFQIAVAIFFAACAVFVATRPSSS